MSTRALAILAGISWLTAGALWGWMFKQVSWHNSVGA